MTKKGIKAVFLTTHNWCKSAKFFGTLKFETDHESGQLRKGDGPFRLITEVPEVEATALVVSVVAEGDVALDGSVKLVTRFEDIRWGTREATVQDPDNRIWRLQVSGAR